MKGGAALEISSLVFLYFFFPAALIIFNLVPQRFKNTVLAAVSLGFIALSQAQRSIFLFADLLLLFGLSEMMVRSRENKAKKKNLLIFAIGFNTLVIIAFSVTNQLSGIFAPFAAMVISFTAIGYFVDLYKDEAKPIRSFSDFVVFLAFFGKLSRGPLIRANEEKKLSGSVGFSLSETGSGLYLFLRGLAKFVVLASPLALLHEELVAANTAELTTVGAWLDMLVFSMMIFFDLSGFCDMARGLGRCFGMELPKNFYFPFQSPSVSDFLDRFNMTVTGFFRHYIYDVLRNDSNSKPQFVVNTVLISLLCGVWFGIEMNYIFWGLYIAAFIIIEEFFLKKILAEIPHIFARIYTFAVTMFSMTIFSASSAGVILPTFRAMFGAGTKMISDEISYIISQNMFILVVGAFFLISAFSMFLRYISKKHQNLFGLVAVLESAVLLVLITAELI